MAFFWQTHSLKAIPMKNAIVVCLVFFAAILKTYSQASIGVRGGILYGHLKSPLRSENIIGWEAGVFSKAEIGEGGAYFQPELDYSQKGGKQFYNDSSFVLRMQYASFRLLGIYNFTDWLFAGAGGYFSYLVKTDQDKEFVKPSYFSPLAAGLVFTGGVQIEAITLALRYDLGGTLITKQSDPEIAGNVLQDSKTRALQLTAGVSF
jgi:hypothetical protein